MGLNFNEEGMDLFIIKIILFLNNFLDRPKHLMSYNRGPPAAYLAHLNIVSNRRMLEEGKREREREIYFCNN